MSLNITYTSTLPKPLMKWLNNYAKQNKLAKNEVIEKALKEYQHQLKKAALESSFKRANKDIEMHQMAEEGLSDYLEQLMNLEN